MVVPVKAFTCRSCACANGARRTTRSRWRAQRGSRRSRADAARPVSRRSRRRRRSIPTSTVTRARPRDRPRRSTAHLHSAEAARPRRGGDCEDVGAYCRPRDRSPSATTADVRPNAVHATRSSGSCARTRASQPRSRRRPLRHERARRRRDGDHDRERDREEQGGPGKAVRPREREGTEHDAGTEGSVCGHATAIGAAIAGTAGLSPRAS